MKITNFNDISSGIYKIKWKTCEGESVAAVGVLHDGVRWFAPTNWTSESPKGVASCNWTKVKWIKIL